MALVFMSSIVVVVVFFSLLPAIYAIAVHFFLVVFRERPTTSLFGGAEWRRHWSPILLRLGYAAFVNIIVIILSGFVAVDAAAVRAGDDIRCYFGGGGDDNLTSCSYWADAMSVLGRILVLVRQQQQQQCITAAAESTTTNICREPTNNDKSITPQQQQQQLIIANATMVILMLTIITTTIIAVSIMLLLQTRKIEVDGPIPPTTPTNNTDDTTTTNYYDNVSGKTIFVTGAKLSI